VLELLPIAAMAINSAAFAVEFAVSRWLVRDQAHSFIDSLTATVLGLGWAISGAIRGLILGVVFIAAYRASPFAWDVANPWSLVAALIVVDFFYYWSHRVSHTLPLWWALHALHHSSTRFNLSLGLRNSWISGWMDWIFVLPAPLLGFHPVLVAAAVAIMQVWDFLCHAHYVGKLPGIDAIFNSPSNHRMHHSVAAAHRLCNLGGMLIIWDRLFGTYIPQTGRVFYGVDPPPPRPYDPIALQYYRGAARGRRA
jgi:sterol desaturase/sphingolipid hydroxylase (fatty acid hydroxylase superfamily)